MFVWMTRYTGCCFDCGLLSPVMLITYTSLLMRNRIWFSPPLLTGFLTNMPSTHRRIITHFAAKHIRYQV